jgi:hypothetical protein
MKCLAKRVLFGGESTHFSKSNRTGLLGFAYFGECQFF